MKLIKSATILILTLAICSFAYAERVPGPNAKPAGDLELVIVASETPDYIKEWLSTPPSHGVTIKRLNIAKPNQLIITSFLVTGYTPDKNGNVSFAVSFVLLDPNGKELFKERHYAKGSGQAPSTPSFIMADPALDITLEQSDPEGVYTIIGFVEDFVSNKRAKTKYIIQFVKKDI